MSAYLVKRPQGIKVNGRVIPAGQTIAAEQIGAKGAVFSMVNMGWIEEQKDFPPKVPDPPKRERVPSAAPTKEPKGKRPVG